MDARFFRSLVGRLIYLTHTRPNISFAVSLVSRTSMHQPSKKHFGAAKRVLRYIARTKGLGIWYTKSDKCELVGH